MPEILAIALNPTVDVSCETETVRPTLKTRTRNQRHDPGGGGINVARVIEELGGAVDVVYLSGGATGALLDDCMERTSVRAHKVPIGQPTRVAYMVHENHTGFEYRFIPEGPQVDPAELKNVLTHVERFEGDYVVASGSLPRGVSHDCYARMAEITGRKNKRFILDSSGRALEEALSTKSVFLVKPSIGELQSLVGEKLDEAGAQNAALDIVKTGRARYVAVSMGMEGAFLASEKGILRLPAKHVRIRSAVGAGDSFVGGMVFSLARGNEVEHAFRLGMAAGTAAVMTSGTQLCRRKDVEALFTPG
ncbi:1-phosphofructokinase family hexose kinase [Hoeflea sp. TYP-13]|uniref:1-phosphofructokinase family hexose kinase n=1 Tax=Hoeflea sp. TYP-13 TaxID=3230023 RepID=UPI0034C648C3